MKNKLITSFLLFLIAFSLSSCATSIASIFPERPSSNFVEDIKRSSPEFQIGWKDGCETGMSAGSNTFYKVFYRNNAVDGYRMANSSEYKTAWSNAFWYCYRHDYVKQKSSIWSSMFSGYQ
jgi:hypothetical protein